MWREKKFKYLLLLVVVLLTIVNDEGVLAKGIHSSSSPSVRRNANNKPSHSNPSLSDTGLRLLSYGFRRKTNKRKNFLQTWTEPDVELQYEDSTPAPVEISVPHRENSTPAYTPKRDEKSPAYKSNFFQPSTDEMPPSRLYSNSRQNGNRFNSSSGGLYGDNLDSPIATSSAHSVQSNYPTQQAPSEPVNCSSYSAPAEAGYVPMGGAYQFPGHLPPGARFYPGGGSAPYYQAAPRTAAPAYYPSSAALPAGAIGSGIPAGGRGLMAGGLLGHKAIEQVPAYNGGGYGAGYFGGYRDNDNNKIIIINNGPPDSVTATVLGGGTTVISTKATHHQTAPQVSSLPALSLQPPETSVDYPAQLAPFEIPSNSSSTNAAGTVGAAAPSTTAGQNLSAQQAVFGPGPAIPSTAAIAAPIKKPAASAGTVGAAAPSTIAGQSLSAQPAVSGPGPAIPSTAAIAAPIKKPATSGGITCIPVKISEPDPNDNTKTIEVEKIACYRAAQPNSSPPAAVGFADEAVSSTAESAATFIALPAAAEGIKHDTPSRDEVLAPIDPNDPRNFMKVPGYFNNY